MTLRSEIATPQGKRRYVRRLFSTIADRYDLITVVLSYGLDRGWKRRLADLARVAPGERALDLACGTGDIAFELAARGARVTGLDITARMIELARRRSHGLGSPKLGVDLASSSEGGRASFLVGDMLALPFPDGSFDLITTGYGIRNVPDIATAVAEMHRTLRPGGRLLSLDFNRPSHRLVRGAYFVYLTLVGSMLGLILHRDPDTYRYIPESIRNYPGADAVCAVMERHGFTRARWMPLLGGLMAINVAEKRLRPARGAGVPNAAAALGWPAGGQHGAAAPPSALRSERMQPDTSKWSGEGTFTQKLIDVLQELDGIECLRVEDAPATRSDADYNFISNEIYVAFATSTRRTPVRRFGVLPGTQTVVEKRLSIAQLDAWLSANAEVGPADYSDAGMIQYLKTERIVQPYQTRGYKLVELVRVYEIGTEPRR